MEKSLRPFFLGFCLNSTILTPMHVGLCLGAQGRLDAVNPVLLQRFITPQVMYRGCCSVPVKNGQRSFP